MSLRLGFCSHEAAKYAVRRWYYRDELPRGKVVRIGVWELGGFAGVLLFGMGAGADLGGRWGLTPFQVCELARLALAPQRDRTTPTSRIVAIAVRLLKKQSPGLRAIVTHADPAVGHAGTVYRAMGWIYTGLTRADVKYVGPDGTEYHSRAVSKTGFKKHRGHMDRCPKISDCRAVKVPGKHRYVLPLDDEIRAVIARDLKKVPAPSAQATQPIFR